MNTVHIRGISKSRTVAPMTRPGAVTRKTLMSENVRFADTGGISQHNRTHGFRPAFRDAQTGTIFLSRFADGRSAPLHLIDGLPGELVTGRSASGAVTAIKPTVVAGFVRDGRFYTREQAARAAG